MSSYSEIGANLVSYENKSENQCDPIDLFVKIIFTTMPKIEDAIDVDSRSMNVAEGIDLRVELDEMPLSYRLFEGNHTTIIILCDDLISDENGICNDPEGLYIKVLEALDETFNFLDKKIDVEKAMVHFALYSFEFCEDALWGYSYLVDSFESKSPINEKLTSYILDTGDPFDTWKERAWFFYVDYIGIFEYYQMFRPLLTGHIAVDNHISNQQTPPKIKEAEVKKEVNVAPHSDETDYSPYAYEDAVETDTLLLRGEVYYNKYVRVVDWLDVTQTSLEILGCFPGVGEVASLINGFVYLGRMTKACLEWDETKTKEYQKKALLNFAGAIPGASIIKGSVKIFKATKAVKAVSKARKSISATTSNLNKSKKALKRITTNKRRRKRKQKEYNKKVDNLHQKELNLENLKIERSKRLKEAGLTISEINNLSKNFLQDPLYFYRKTMELADKDILLKKLPDLRLDSVIEIIWDTPGYGEKFYKAFNSLNEGDYEKAEEEFKNIIRNGLFDILKVIHPGQSKCINTTKKLTDKAININND